MAENYRFKQVFTAACAGMLFFGIVIISLGSILPSLIEKFDLNEIDSGTLASLLPFGILTGSLIFGPVVDRYSYKYLLIVSSLLVIAGLEIVALSSHFSSLKVAFFLIGTGGGAINGGTNALVSDISPKSANEKSANLSFLGVFFGIGALAMPFVLGLLFEKFRFETIFSGFGVILLSAIFLFSVTKFPEPKQVKSFPVKEGLALLKNYSLLLLGVILFFQSGIEGIINNWTTTFLINETGTGHRDSMYALSIFVLSLVLTRLLLSRLFRKIRPFIVLTIFLALAFLGGFVIIYLPQWAIPGLVLLGIGLAPVFPVILAYTGDIFDNLAGTAFSVVFVFALTGNIIINYLMGIIAHIYGLEQYAILLIASILFLAIFLFITLPKISNKTRI